MTPTRLRLVALCAAGLCVAGVVAGVVATGRDGRTTDLLAVIAVAALVVAWRLHTHLRHESLED